MSRLTTPAPRMEKLLDNLLTGKMTKKAAMLDAGYSKSSAVHPTQTLNTKTFKEMSKKILLKVDMERNRLIEEITSRDLDKISYEAAVRSYETLTKTNQLLQGKATENININEVIGFNLIELPQNDTPGPVETEKPPENFSSENHSTTTQDDNDVKI